MFWRKKGKDANGEVKMFFASDLHGSNVCFKKFVNSAKFYGVDVLVLGGDLTGKAVIPIAEQEDGTFVALQHGEQVQIADKERARRLRQAARQHGFLSCGHVGVGVPAPEGAIRRRSSRRCSRSSFWSACGNGRASPPRKLKGTDIPLVTVPGNDDFVEIDEILTQAPVFDFHEMQVCEFKGGYQMLYCGGSTPTPWDTEREYTEEQYVTRFAELLPQVTDMSRCIFNVHVPPFGTALDACPKLDKNLKVVYEMGLPAQVHAGCQTLIDIIKEHQPLLGLHGHIHEGRAKINIGKTICINPGSVYPEGILQGALITLRDGQVTQANLMQG